MLNRRYLRIKVMQALYGFFQSEKHDLASGEKELFQNIDKVYDLFIWQLALLVELRHVANTAIEDAKTKHIVTEENLNPNLKFIENKFIKLLAENIQFKTEVNHRKINWNNDFELVRKIFNTIKVSNPYAAYMSSEDNTYKTHRNFIIEIFRELIADFELLNHFYEERNLHWGDDIYIVNPVILRTIESFKEDNNPFASLTPLFKDEQEDSAFVRNLFCQTILRNQEIEKLIGDKTKNWEVDRIALMDVLLMKMAVAEIIHFSGIPVKVTLNEYIEISKTFSTPKSNLFINGILDKLVADLKRENKFVKVGRGLVE